MTLGRRPRNMATIRAVCCTRAAAATVLAALSVGACVAHTTGGGSAAVTSNLSAATSGPYTDNDTAAQRHAETVAYAERILAERPVLNGEVPFSGTVPKKLSEPDDVPAASNRLVRSRYVTVDRSPHRLYEELKAAPAPPESQLGGYGDVSAHPDGPRSAFVRFDRDTLPPTMVDGELLIEIQGRAHKPTLLAEFAQDVPHPAWTKAERIPAPDSSTTITRTKYSQRGHVIKRRAVTLRHVPSAALVTAFDNSWVAPPWQCTGGPLGIGPYVSFSAEIQSDGHTWTVLTPGGCGVSSVTRGAHDVLPGVNVSSQFAHLVRADSRPPS
jgi:hypothetical protein